jgi:hypothetical protein
MNPDKIAKNTYEEELLQEIYIKELADQDDLMMEMETENLIAAILVDDLEKYDLQKKTEAVRAVSLSGSLVQSSHKFTELWKAQESLNSVKINKNTDKVPFLLLIDSGCRAIPSMREMNYSRFFNVTPAIMNKIRKLGIASQVRDIEFSKNFLQRSLPENLFEGFVNLERINLSQNNLHYLPENIFKDLISLKILDLSWNKLGRKSFVALSSGLLSGLDNLEYIDLSRNNLQCLPENIFKDRMSLKGIALNNNDLDRRLPKGLFDNLPSLELVNLNYNLLLDQGHSFFKLEIEPDPSIRIIPGLPQPYKSTIVAKLLNDENDVYKLSYAIQEKKPWGFTLSYDQKKALDEKMQPKLHKLLEEQKMFLLEYTRSQKGFEDVNGDIVDTVISYLRM